ncbi:MAG: hypothetical protein O2782_17880 [bacterium]|nr:hypothetical protein [bacterium]
MLHIIVAEWRNNWIWMMSIFALMSAVWLGVTYLPGQSPEVNLAILGMVSAFPMMMSLIVLGAHQAEARRQRLWASVPLPRTQLGIAHGLVLLSPWVLATVNAWLLGRLSAEAELPTVVFSWSGLLLVLVAAHWVLKTFLGPLAAMIGALATIVAIFSLEAIILLLAGPFGWDFSSAADHRPSLHFWASMRDPVTGLLLYGLGAALALAAVRRFAPVAQEQAADA